MYTLQNCKPKVRDVRAVVHSRLRIDGFCLHYGAPGCAQPVCDGMAAARAGVQQAPLDHGRSEKTTRARSPSGHHRLLDDF